MKQNLLEADPAGLVFNSQASECVQTSRHSSPQQKFTIKIEALIKAEASEGSYGRWSFKIRSF